MSDINYMQNRELSWLKFNERVLEKGKLETLPLYERLKFVSIFDSNLTEFFMVRVGSLTDLSLLKNQPRDNKTGWSASEQLDRIYQDVRPLYAMKDIIFYEVEKRFREIGISNLKYDELNVEEKKWVDNYYLNHIHPLMSPNVVHKMHPFPFMENKIIHIVAELVDKEGKTCYLILPIRGNIPKLIKIDGTTNYIMMEEVILNFAESLVPNYQIKDKFIVRVTRNSDINLEQNSDEDEDYKKYVKKILKNRRRLAAVRLEVNKTLSNKVEKFLIKNLELKKENIYITSSPIDLGYVWGLPNTLGAEHFTEIAHNKFTPRKTNMVDEDLSLMAQIEKKDVFLSYPYESMDTLIKLIREAAVDPRVFSIKVTIYRLASNSQLVRYLLRAADEGKEVTALMELRARFDEENNIDYSEELLKGGVNVLYGIENFKVHSKVCLISYRDDNQTKYITHLGTGNYNESTAKLYQDMNIITAHNGIGLDANNFFNNLQISKIDNAYDYLIQSPSTLRQTILELMDKEIQKGEEGYLRLKCNSVTDKGIIEKISEASQNGVKVDMVVRGICCILPGVEGATENVDVISLVGRFLEHARIYQFGKGDRAQIYISSADLMSRNTQRRVEIGTPVLDPDIRRYLLEFLDKQFKDTVNAKRLLPTGEYINVEGEYFDSHDFQIHYVPEYLSRQIEEIVETEEQPVPVDITNVEPTRLEAQSSEGFFKELWNKIKSIFS